MAIVNPNAQSKGGSLLDQVLAEREALAGNNPSSQPGAPIRNLVQQPGLQTESPGSARVASVKPNLQVEAQTAVPPSSQDLGQPGATAPVAGPGVVGPNQFQEQPLPPGPAAPGGSMYQDPNARPSNGGGGNSAPAPAPSAAAAPGRPAAIRTFTPPAASRISNRYIVDLPTKLQPRRDSGLA